ncbi:MAG: hypothetical protein JNL28_16385 [Planctomycetes bacterium]|nr:hypothetical protein [Planctomycetota bacterium]
MRLTQGRGLRVIDEVVSAPNDDLRILLDGYVVVARTLDARGDECERTRVRAVYQPVDEVGGARPAAVEWSALTDAQGEARFVVSGPGRVTLSARNLEWVAPAHGVALLGPSGTHVVTLNLLDYEPLGSLRVLLTDCETGARITDFCLGVFDARTGEKVLRFCSAECDANGSFPAVPAGSYRIRAEPRFTSEPVYYSTDSSAWADVDVRSETESTAAMCVSLGGRIALRIDGPSGVAVPNEVKNVSVSASLVSGGRPIQLKFRTLDLQGLQVSVYIEIGSECVTENVLKAGRYKLTVTGPGFQDSELFVDVIAERSVPAVCKLLRQQ